MATDLRSQILRLIDEATEPPMTREDAVEWLDELLADIEGRQDALREEMRAEADGD